ncbi:uncharacterized protein LOC144705421 isoform X2 [Wolffia australiana]
MILKTRYLKYFPDFKSSIRVEDESSDLLNSDGEKNDYEWLLAAPQPPLFPSLDDEEPISAKQTQSVSIPKSPAREIRGRKSRGSISPRGQSPSSRSISGMPVSGRHPSPTAKPATSNSRSLTPTVKRTDSLSSTKKASRGSSPSPKIQRWQSTCSGSYKNIGETPQWNRRHSLSPTASASFSSSHSHDQDSFSNHSKSSVLSSGDDFEALRFPRKNGHFYRAQSSCTAPKRSFDTAIQRMDHHRTSEEIFRGIMPTTPRRTFSLENGTETRHPVFSRNASVLTSSDGSAELDPCAVPEKMFNLVRREELHPSDEMEPPLIQRVEGKIVLDELTDSSSHPQKLESSVIDEGQVLRRETINSLLEISSTELTEKISNFGGISDHRRRFHSFDSCQGLRVDDHGGKGIQRSKSDRPIDLNCSLHGKPSTATVDDRSSDWRREIYPKNQIGPAQHEVRVLRTELSSSPPRNSTLHGKPSTLTIDDGESDWRREGYPTCQIEPSQHEVRVLRTESSSYPPRNSALCQKPSPSTVDDGKLDWRREGYPKYQLGPSQHEVRVLRIESSSSSPRSSMNSHQEEESPKALDFCHVDDSNERDNRVNGNAGPCVKDLPQSSLDGTAENIYNDDDEKANFRAIQREEASSSLGRTATKPVLMKIDEIARIDLTQGEADVMVEVPDWSTMRPFGNENDNDDEKRIYVMPIEREAGTPSSSSTTRSPGSCSVVSVSRETDGVAQVDLTQDVMVETLTGVKMRCLGNANDDDDDNRILVMPVEREAGTPSSSTTARSSRFCSIDPVSRETDGVTQIDQTQGKANVMAEVPEGSKISCLENADDDDDDDHERINFMAIEREAASPNSTSTARPSHSCSTDAVSLQTGNIIVIDRTRDEAGVSAGNKTMCQDNAHDDDKIITSRAIERGATSPSSISTARSSRSCSFEPISRKTDHVIQVDPTKGEVMFLVEPPENKTKRSTLEKPKDTNLFHSSITQDLSIIATENDCCKTPKKTPLQIVDQTSIFISNKIPYRGRTSMKRRVPSGGNTEKSSTMRASRAKSSKASSSNSCSCMVM